MSSFVLAVPQELAAGLRSMTSLVSLIRAPNGGSGDAAGGGRSR